jgi:hypothetical protein
MSQKSLKNAMNQKKPVLSASSERNTFQRDSYIKRKLEEGCSLDDPDVQAMIHWYDSWTEESEKQEADPEWQKNNLEYDLRSTDWIIEKVRASESYAQNLYAALCNNDFQRQDVWPVLKDQKYTCSWRYAGGIIADMREQGDYIDWYCSGIRGGMSYDEVLPKELVPEGTVTDEVRADLLQLGWAVVTDAGEDY